MKLLLQMVVLFISVAIFLPGCQFMTMTPLSRASATGDVKTIHELINKGDDLNLPGEESFHASALHWACRYGRDEAAKVLIEAGANVNSLDVCRQTPIFYAIYSSKIRSSSLEVVRTLINKGAYLNIKDCNNMMPIDYARENQDLAVTELILSKSPESVERVKKAKINEYSTLNLPLNIANCREAEVHKAASEGDITKIKALISAGADFDEADCLGYRALDYANHMNDEAIIKLISSQVQNSHKGDHYSPKTIIRSGKICATIWPCGVGDFSINYNNAEPKINYKGSKKLAIAIYDERTYIRTKEKKPEYVGYTRESWRLPTDMTTRDGRPIAQTLGKLIADAYRNADLKVVGVSFDYNTNDKANLEGILQNKPDRLMTIKLSEWIIETQYAVENVTFKYSLDFNITDDQGKVLFAKIFSGQEIIAGAKWYSYMRSSIVAPEITYYLFTDILNKPEVAEALR
jgi:ankyrin repeat protein